MQRGSGARLFVISFLVGVVLIGAVAAAARWRALDGSTPIVFAEVGDCFVLPDPGDGTSIELIEVIECDRAHDAEVVATGELNPNADLPYPDDDTLFARTASACGDPQRYDSAGFGVLPVSPNELTWNQRKGRFVCVALTRQGRMVTGRQTAPVADV